MKKAKKRSSQKRSSQSKRQKSRRRDTHHIFWPRHDWNRGWAKTLRTHWYMRVDIPMLTLHREIHHQILMVPVPKAVNIQGALQQLNLLEKHGAIHPYDTLEKRLYILLALFDCCEPATHAAIKHQYDVVRKYYKSPRK